MAKPQAFVIMRCDISCPKPREWPVEVVVEQNERDAARRRCRELWEEFWPKAWFWAEPVDNINVY